MKQLLKKRSILLAVLITGLLVPTISGQEPTQFVYTLSYRFENRGDSDYQLSEEDVSIPLFMNTYRQTVKLEEVDSDYSRKIIDVDGNSGAVVGVNRLLAPGQEISFSAVYKIYSSERSIPDFNVQDALGFDSIPIELIEEYTISTETFPRDDPLFYNVSTMIIDYDDSVLEAVSKLIEYIMEEITYNNFEVPQYPDKTLESNLGDCDDQSILLITMARSLNIPAYLQVGIYIHPSINDRDTSWEDHLINEAKGVGWHGWAMIYIPPWGWIPIDLTLTSAKSGLELIRKAPEYGVNIIPAFNVSRQSYIGETLQTRDRILQSEIYVTIKDEAKILYSADNPFQNYVLIGLGMSLLLAIGLMFRAGKKDKIN